MPFDPFKLKLKDFKDPEALTRTIGIRQMAKAFPNYAEELIGRVLKLKDPEEFKKLILNSYDLCGVAQVFPNLADELIGRVLKDPEEFKRLIKNIFDLREAAIVFPNHGAILGQVSIEAAIKLVEIKADIAEIKKNSRLMRVLRRREDSLFSQIPEEIAAKIVADTRNFTYLKDKQTSDIIEQDYENNPPQKK